MNCGSSTCSVFGNAQNALSNALINGAGATAEETESNQSSVRRLEEEDGSVVMAYCVGAESCRGVQIIGDAASYVFIECIGVNGCGDIDVYCPEHVDGEKQCVLSGGNEDVHRSLDLYAVHGFEDVDVSGYSAILENTTGVFGESTNMNRMHCGDGYTTYCTLNESLLCQCGEEEKKEDGGGGVIGNNQWAAAIIILIVLLIGSGVVVYWMVAKNGSHKEHDKYSSVRHGTDDEDFYGDDDYGHNGKDNGHYHDDDEDIVDGRPTLAGPPLNGHSHSGGGRYENDGVHRGTGLPKQPKLNSANSRKSTEIHKKS